MAITQAPVPDHALVHHALFNCRNIRHIENIDQPLLYDLLRIEKEVGIPSRLRGMTLAAACHESGFNPRAQGDWTIRRNRRYSRARGILQLWPWWVKQYGISRYNPRQSARTWLQHIKDAVPKAERFCRQRGHRAWLTAWALIARGPGRKGNKWRCRDRVSHYKVLRRWQKKVLDI